MRARGEFFITKERPQPPAANDNRIGDENSVALNLVSTQLTYTLAILARDKGAT